MTVRLISVARINGPGRLLFTRNIGHKAATIIPANEARRRRASCHTAHSSAPLIAAKDETIKVLTSNAAAALAKAESNAAALIAAKDETIKVLTKAESNMAALIAAKDETIQELRLKYQAEVISKAHLGHMLTLRWLIGKTDFTNQISFEQYEKRFPIGIKDKNISRRDKWTTYFASDELRFKPFVVTGLAAKTVAHEVDVLFNSEVRRYRKQAIN